MGTTHLNTTQDSDNILLQEALSLHDQGIGVYLTDPVTNTKIGRYSEFDPIDDRDLLSQLCTEVPDANLNIAIDQIYDLVALAVGVGSGKDLADESFAELCRFHGNPETIGYLLPTGERYYLFKYDEGDLDLKDKPGLAFKKSNESLLVYSSQSVDGEIQKIGADTIRKFSDWASNEISQAKVPECGVQHLPEIIEQIPVISVKPTDSVSSEKRADETTSDNSSQQDQKQSGTEDLETQIADWLRDNRSKSEIIAELTDRYTGKESALQNRQIQRMVITVAAELNTSEGDESLSGDTALLLEVADLEFVIFKDEHSKGHLFIKDSGTNLAITHPSVPKLLVYKFRKIFGRLPAPARVKEAVQIIEMTAEYDSDQITLHNRVAKRDGAFYYDMGDSRSIRTTKDGWEIIPSPILFRRHSHQIVQVDPTPEGDARKIFDFLNVKLEDHLLLLVYIISLLIPGIPHPVFHPWGDFGSAKSFLCTVINLFCDPTSVTKMILNKKESDAIQIFFKHYVSVLDNLSEIPEWLSDLICQACTGSSFNKRKLYTDSDDVIFTIKHCIILNSLEMLIVKPDLMQRTITMHIEKPAIVREEEEVWRAFQESRGKILGGMFGVLVKAMGIYPTVALSNLPRMADFYRWGYAIAQALGNHGEQFIKDYQANIMRQHEGVMHHNALCQAVVELMEKRSEYKSTVGQTLKKLKDIASPSRTDQSFPTDAKNLGRSLGLISQTLAGFGITFIIEKRQGKGTPIKILKNSISPSSPSPDSPVLSQAAATPCKSEVGEPHEAHSEIPLVILDAEFEVVNA